MALNYCSVQKFQLSTNENSLMHFTKEAINREYAGLDEFKSLHCCAKGYRNIEWYKDGVPYPWAKAISSFILYPEAANQTIYIRSTSQSDFGNYTCIIRNDTTTIEHRIDFKFQDNIPDRPLTTYQPVDQTINLGDPVRLYCEAFVGKINLPDAKNSVSWFQVFDGEFVPSQNGIQENIERDDGRIIGAYLRIDKTILHNFGQYVCRIEIGHPEHRTEMHVWLLQKEIYNHSLVIPLLLAFIAAISTVSFVYFIKRKFLNLSSNNNQENSDNCCKNKKISKNILNFKSTV